jgi:class 3 adenylate cyclase/tetratricopeptide (TPR) repeat protein
MEDCVETLVPVTVRGGRVMSSAVTATFVFTDMVDSTATAARIGPDAAEHLRHTHFHLLRGAVQASGGTEVKSLGDGLVVVYSSPSRAVRGAVGMQQAIEHHNRSAALQLAVRIGMSTGEAVEEEGDFFGDPVVEAARLCAAASGGQILASDIVRLMVGRRISQTFIAVGPMELKGIPQPVDAVEVVWEPLSRDASVPLPGRLVIAATEALFGFFGRAPELSVLNEARKRAHTSERVQVVLVAGEAGIGKTALVARAARAAHAEGSVVLFGHADEDLGIAYQPWIEVFETLARQGDPVLVGGLRAAQRGALAHLVPEIGDEGLQVADPDMERLLLLEAATELLASASKEASVLVVLDDLQWADTASLQMLRHLIASTTPMDVVISCTYRNTDLGRGSLLTKLLSDLHREANVARFVVRGLEDEELIELLEAAAGHQLDQRGVGLAHALHRETDGNPFFIAEIVRHLGETGGIFLGEDRRWRIAAGLEEVGLPTSVRDVVGRRVERLGDEALRALSIAAVIGQEFDLGVLAEVTNQDEDRLLDLIDAAASAAVLVEAQTAERYRFAHALIQHSLYDELSPARRQRAHHRIAEALEARASGDDLASLAELARHWAAATRPADLDKALRYVRRAGDAARSALAPEEAIRWYQQALDLIARQSPPDDHQRGELLATLGAVQTQVSHPEGRDTLLQAARLARQLNDKDVLVQAALGFSPFALVGWVAGDDDAKLVIRAALERISPEVTPTRARLLAALSMTYDLRTGGQERGNLAHQAVDVARRAGDDATFVDVVDLASPMLDRPDRLEEYLNNIEAAATMADQIGDPVLQSRIRARLLGARYKMADIERADVVIGEIETFAEAIGLPAQRWQHAGFVTTRLLLAGDASAAETANERLLEIGTAAGVPETLAAFGGMLYAIRLHQGRLSEIADLFLQAASDNPSIAALRSAVPVLFCELDRIDEAREHLAADAATGFDYPYDTTWLGAIVNLADAAANLGYRIAAGTLVERLAPFANQVVVPAGIMVCGAAARPLARLLTLLGRYEEAERWFETAHDIDGRLQAPYWTARGELDHADLCLARHADHDMTRARDLATAAEALATEYGCSALARRAANILADIGITE